MSNTLTVADVQRFAQSHEFRVLSGAVMVEHAMAMTVERLAPGHHSEPAIVSKRFVWNWIQ